ncbi:MAG: hypothetical protein ICV66_05880 [Chitinophagaceae bacterium]|nr:hypothetical protein [Chitinophagaceae bacterium]
MLRAKAKEFYPIILIFIAFNALFISSRSWLFRSHVNQDVLIIGNLILFVITLLSFLLAKRNLTNPNPNVFVRTVYASIMLKIFLCVIAAFVYIALYRENINKPALFACMGLYLIYTFTEVSILMKLLKKKTNA